MRLAIAKNLTLPTDAVTQTIAILARRGAGKTYTASVLAEEFVRAKLPFVALDPTGAWWGLRAAADGKSAGLPVVILGGLHGDVPLGPDSGKLVADLVVDQPGWYVLDLRLFRSKSEQDRFATDFAEHLYRRKLRTPSPLHVIVDEADCFAPQRPQRGQERMLGAFEDLVRRGRISGIGLTLISQRAAVINKNVLSQIECLIALQTTSPHDRAAIQAWAEGHGTPDQVRALMGSLAGLGRGEAWFWSPEWLNVFQRAQIRVRHTYNSSATPKAGARVAEPRRLASVDIEALKAKMAESIVKASAEDPRALRARIDDLERALARTVRRAETAEKHIAAAPVPVPAAGADRRLIAEAVRLLEKSAAPFDRACALLREAAGHTATAAHRRIGTPPAGAKTVRATPSATGLRSGAVRILREIAARHPAGYTRSQVATLTGFSPRGGTYQTYLGDLRRTGAIEERADTVYATAAGIASLGQDIQPAPTKHSEVMAMWARALRAGAYRMLDRVVAAKNAGIGRTALADAVGMEARGGTYNTYLGDLRRNGLIVERDGVIFASDILFPVGDK